MGDIDAAGALERWLAISRPVERITGRLEAALSQRHGVSLSGYEVLFRLAARRGWTPMLEICEVVELSQPRLSRLVAQLCDDGLLERERVDGDGRAFQIRLTRKGRRTHGAASESVVEILDRASTAPGSVAALLRAGPGA